MCKSNGTKRFFFLETNVTFRAGNYIMCTYFIFFFSTVWLACFRP